VLCIYEKGSNMPKSEFLLLCPEAFAPVLLPMPPILVGCKGVMGERGIILVPDVGRKGVSVGGDDRPMPRPMPPLLCCCDWNPPALPAPMGAMGAIGTIGFIPDMLPADWKPPKADEDDVRLPRVCDNGGVPAGFC